ncbi:hypothetical protein SKM57_12580 [Acinetobacter faecalis]|uniref:hypothetical protein n=1 Tax=Acinetobacter faecalis TaxID=2665161 RepID=UPI002A90A2FE|nr:hypothetical protein [Acinetobacter faecalis]MDY6469411.1 hypothetical protein [Acinetobacter faecalis]
MYKKSVLLLGMFCTAQVYSGLVTVDNFQIDDTQNALKVSGDGNHVIGSHYIPGSFQRSYYYNVIDGTKEDIKSLRGDNSGVVDVKAISYDGKVITGRATNDFGLITAFRYDTITGEIINLGSLEGSRGTSDVLGISADGTTIIGDSSVTSGSRRAFKHVSGDQSLTDLGTLHDLNRGDSYALDVSDNGASIVGYATNSDWVLEAYRYDADTGLMVGLGKLGSSIDNSLSPMISTANAVSGDGRVVVGRALTDNNNFQAFLHVKGDLKMTSIGTLNTDNSGNSEAIDVSGTGDVITGNSDINVGFRSNNQAFRYEINGSKLIGLGTLKSDNSGDSSATAISKNGMVIVGFSDTDSGITQAFRHDKNDKKMTALGSLRSDNTGPSYASSVSDDGAIVVGKAINNDGEERGVIWKTTKAIDVENTYISMFNNTGRQILNIYENYLWNFADSHCYLKSNQNYCISLYTNYNTQNSNELYATGLRGALKVGESGWSLGGAFNFNLFDNLVDGFNAKGYHLPGISSYIRYNQNTDETGYIAELKGAYLKQNLVITRAQLSGTEQGVGEAKLQGYIADIGMGFGLIANNQTLVTPKLNLKYTNVARDAYIENNNIDLPAKYSEIVGGGTDLIFSVNMKHQLTSALEFDGTLGTGYQISSNKKRAVVSMDFLGKYEEKYNDDNKIKPFAKLGVSYNLKNNTYMGINVLWNKTSTHKDFSHIGFNVSSKW